jgi:hypothetical protein
MVMEDVPVDVLTLGLAALPNLTSLSFTGDAALDVADFQAALAATSGRLTRLEFDGFVDCAESILQSPQVMSKLSNLRVISFDDMYSGCDDLWFNALLALPHLTHVTIPYNLLCESHAHKACTWQELRLSFGAYIMGLGKLPLRGVRRLVLGGGVRLGSHADNITLHQVEAELANVPASCCVSTPPNGALKLSCQDEYGHRIMPLLLPLLHRCEGVRTLHLDGWGSRMKPRTAAAIGAHLARVPSCTTLTLEQWKPHASAQLLTALAPTCVTRLLLINGLALSKAAVMLWRSGNAERDVTVEIAPPIGYWVHRISPSPSPEPEL